MGVNVGEEGRTHKTNELYSVELWFAPAAQPHWHVFSRFWHNICPVLFIYLFYFFPEFQKEFLKKIAQLPIHSLPNALLQSVSHQTCLLFKKLAEYCGKKKRSISTELHITLSPTSAKLSPSWEEHKLKSSIWAHREATRPWRVELLLSYSTGKPQGARFFPR